MAEWWTLWWVWAAAAMVLGILEVILPGYIFLGFALGALALAVIEGFGLVTLSMPWSLVVFAAFSLVAYVALRRLLGIRNGQIRIWDRDINEP